VCECGWVGVCECVCVCCVCVCLNPCVWLMNTSTNTAYAKHSSNWTTGALNLFGAWLFNVFSILIRAQLLETGKAELGVVLYKKTQPTPFL